MNPHQVSAALRESVDRHRAWAGQLPKMTRGDSKAFELVLTREADNLELIADELEPGGAAKMNTGMPC